MKFIFDIFSLKVFIFTTNVVNLNIFIFFGSHQQPMPGIRSKRSKFEIILVLLYLYNHVYNGTMNICFGSGFIIHSLIHCSYNNVTERNIFVVVDFILDLFFSSFFGFVFRTNTKHWLVQVWRSQRKKHNLWQ